MAAQESTRTYRKAARVLGELSLIFIGVLLALAADDWRERQQQAESGRAALRAMLADLAADSAALVGVVSSYAADDTSGARLLANLSNERFPSDSVEAYLAPFYQGTPYAPSRAGFTIAVQTGALQFIDNEELRLQLVSYFEQSNAVFSQNFEEVLEEVAQLHELLKPYLRIAIPSSVVAAWPPPERARRVQAPWNVLRTDNALTVQLLEYAAYAGYFAAVAQGRLNENQALQRAIKAELETSR